MRLEKYRVVLVILNEYNEEERHVLANNLISEQAAERHAVDLQHQHPQSEIAVETYRL